MDAQRVREIASNAGKSAHLKGTAHEFTSEEARAAGRKGGRVRAERARLRRLAESEARTVQTNT